MTSKKFKFLYVGCCWHLPSFLYYIYQSLFCTIAIICRAREKLNWFKLSGLHHNRWRNPLLKKILDIISLQPKMLVFSRRLLQGLGGYFFFMLCQYQKRSKSVVRSDDMSFIEWHKMAQIEEFYIFWKVKATRGDNVKLLFCWERAFALFGV